MNCKFKEFKLLQSLNIESISVTFVASKLLLNVIEFKFLHESNILLILVTFIVSKIDKSSIVKLEHP